MSPFLSGLARLFISKQWAAVRTQFLWIRVPVQPEPTTAPVNNSEIYWLIINFSSTLIRLIWIFPVIYLYQYHTNTPTYPIILIIPIWTRNASWTPSLWLKNFPEFLLSLWTTSNRQKLIKRETETIILTVEWGAGYWRWRWTLKVRGVRLQGSSSCFSALHWSSALSQTIEKLVGRFTSSSWCLPTDVPPPPLQAPCGCEAMCIKTH